MNEQQMVPFYCWYVYKRSLFFPLLIYVILYKKQNHIYIFCCCRMQLKQKTCQQMDNFFTIFDPSATGTRPQFTSYASASQNEKI